MTKLFLFFRSVSGYLCVLLWGEMRNFLSTHFLWRSFCFVLLDLCLNFAFLSKNFVGTFSFRSSHCRILCRLMCVVSFILLQIKSSRVEKLFLVWFHRMVCVCVCEKGVIFFVGNIVVRFVCSFVRLICLLTNWFYFILNRQCHLQSHFFGNTQCCYCSKFIDSHTGLRCCCCSLLSIESSTTASLRSPLFPCKEQKFFYQNKSKDFLSFFFCSLSSCV